MKPEIVLEQPRKVTVVESIVEQIVRQIQAGKLEPDRWGKVRRRLHRVYGRLCAPREHLADADRSASRDPRGNVRYVPHLGRSQGAQ